MKRKVAVETEHRKPLLTKEEGEDEDASDDADATDGEVDAGGGTGSIAAANRAISRSYGRWQSLLLWVCYFATFTFYVAAEIGLANWLPPFATLFGLASEADAALLTTAFYATFTCTRLLAAFTISRQFSSVAILSACFVGSAGSIGLIWLAVSISDSKWKKKIS